MEIDECIICFEPIQKTQTISLFQCNHKENMHLECIRDLHLCPLCRSPRIDIARVCVFIIHESRNRVYSTSVFVIFYLACFSFLVGLYVLYSEIKDEIAKNNSTYVIDHT